MIVYEFQARDFSAAEGYTRFEVRNGILELEGEPEPALLALIEKHQGKRIEPEATTWVASVNKPRKTKKKREFEVEVDPWR